MLFILHPNSLKSMNSMHNTTFKNLTLLNFFMEQWWMKYVGPHNLDELGLHIHTIHINIESKFL